LLIVSEEIVGQGESVHVFIVPLDNKACTVRVGAVGQ
jgi:hypothetical protein